ncbi:Type 1 phosphatases regulator ypi1 [Coemansia erecta]|nr:Type 1 phosphatases regulator ypi1 [Coemansia erecta]
MPTTAANRSSSTARDGSNIHVFQPSNSEASLLAHNSSDSNMLAPHNAGHGSYGGRVLARSNTPSRGSRTMVITPNEEASEPASSSSGGVLFLRGNNVPSQERQQPRSRGPQVRWTDDTVDNEDMNKKKSKVCCIFRKERQFGESDSDETDSSCCSGHDSDDSPNEYERMPRYGRPGKHSHSH